MIELALPLLYTIAGILFFLEHRYPAHPAVVSKPWYARAILINALQLAIFIVVDTLWLKHAAGWSVFTVTDSMSAPASALLAYFVFTFVVYWWHRLRHRSPLIWRLFHQLHHSPQRIQTLTAYNIHPLDMIANLTISNSILFLLLGLNLEAAAWYTLITGAAGFIIHANIRLPRQVGYLFQTPEMHRLHHKFGHHAHNYSDIVFWDMSFGTYCNPHEDITHCGFDENQEDERHEKKIVAMLLGKTFLPPGSKSAC